MNRFNKVKLVCYVNFLFFIRKKVKNEQCVIEILTTCV